jgi:hypothetical protein
VKGKNPGITPGPVIPQAYIRSAMIGAKIAALLDEIMMPLGMSAKLPPDLPCQPREREVADTVAEITVQTLGRLISTRVSERVYDGSVSAMATAADALTRAAATGYRRTRP